MTHRRGATDPQRKERILEAALAVIANTGVHATTHRRIAHEAGLPLGSLTYHFESLEQIFVEAFDRLAVAMTERFQSAFAVAGDQAEAGAAVAGLICGDDFATERELVILYQMYSYASHNEVVARLTRSWLERSQELLSKHFSPQASQAIDALVEGWVIHRTFSRLPPDHVLVESVVNAIADRYPRR